MEDYFKKIIELFTESNVSTSSKDEFHRWLTGDKFFQEKERALRDVWNTMPENGLAEVSPNTRRSLKDVYKKIRRRRRRKISIGILRLWQVSAACLLIALLSTFYIFSDNTPATIDLVELYVPTAEISHLTLPDGTRVQMNSNATLLYPEQFTGESRCVYLMGEANFKIAKNEKQPFIVKSNDFQVTALGTEFNLQVYPNESTISTTLLSGCVEVRFNNQSTAQVLRPNEQLTYNKHTKEGTISRPDINDVTAWQRGELVFKSVTLHDIFKVLERKYPYSFVYALNTLEDDKYMFRFKDKTSIQEVMDIIVEVSGNIRYKIEGDKCCISPL
jgi:ferric-dicitrate binding protein FerR (iron transport regulator)